VFAIEKKAVVFELPHPQTFHTIKSNFSSCELTPKMTESLLTWFYETLPAEVSHSAIHQLNIFGPYENIFALPICRLLLGHEQNAALKEVQLNEFSSWSSYIRNRLQIVIRSETSVTPSYYLFLIALSSMNAFLQSNVTGPPLSIRSDELLFPETIANDLARIKATRKDLIDSLAVDGVSAYRLVPNIELFCLAKEILLNDQIVENVTVSRWARLRVNFLHQRLLSETAPTLQNIVSNDLEWLSIRFQSSELHEIDPNVRAAFFLESVSIQMHFGMDKEAKDLLTQATKARGFTFALTGVLGKRTKFQQKDNSQLVVLAKSTERESDLTEANASRTAGQRSKLIPKTVDLNDDTLLESISFSSTNRNAAEIQTEDSLPASLKALDLENQPILNPLDSIILLSTAASITNTSPANGLTREETLPYALRVLGGGSSNWQVYTQALLVRSRIEGYKSRSVERGLLQMQALLDQVIADTADPDDANESSSKPTTFLPRPQKEESASAEERLLYIYQLATPTRWELEAELAARWVNLGGLKTALEIYERLEMWPEVALCWAGTDRNDKARKIIRRQLFHATGGDEANVDPDAEKWTGKERDPPPADASRLWCILGDLDKDHLMYEKAWELSHHRYFRAQKSLGQYWHGERDYVKASLAFSKAVKLRQLDHGTWFALGCALLELSQFSRASEVFSRAVQLDDGDAESWSNLAVSLLNIDQEDQSENIKSDKQLQPQLDDERNEENIRGLLVEPQKNRKDALTALKQAAKLKRDSYRIWDNLLTVSASLRPPSYSDIIAAQQHLIDLRGSTDGETCIDENILNALVNFVTSSSDKANSDHNPDKPGIARMTCQMVDRSVVPLITSSSRLWYIVAQLALWRDRPSTALDAYEKAWRVIIQQPGWEHGTEEDWNKVVEITSKLVEAYKDLGPRVRTEGMGADTGELVRKDWAFKARTAVRGILGRGKESWEDSKGWCALKDLSATITK
jgi:Flp pilus assembly protein TadD